MKELNSINSLKVSLDKNRDKYKHIQGQMSKVFRAFSERPKTMLMVRLKLEY